MTIYIPIDKCEECSYYAEGYDLDNGTCADVCGYFNEGHLIYDNTKIQEWCPFLKPSFYMKGIDKKEITWKDLCCELLNEKSVLTFENSKLKQELWKIKKGWNK